MNDWLVRLALLGLLLHLSGQPGVTGATPGWGLAAGGLLLILSAWQSWRQGCSFRKSVSVWLCCLCAWSALALTNSLCLPLSALALANLAGCTGACLALEFSLSSRSNWHTAASFLTTVLTGHALWAFFVGSGMDTSVALKGNFTNADCYSALLSLGFFLALGLALEVPHRAGRVFFSLNALILLCGVVLSASRAGALGLGAGYLVFLFMLASSRSGRLRGVAKKLLVVPAGVILLFTLTGINVHLLERFSHLSQARDQANLKSRVDVLRSGWRTVLRHPIVGNGPGCFALAYQQDRPPIIAGEDFVNVAHNDYVQWLIETGVVGGVLWLLVLGSAVRRAWRSYRLPTPWVAGILGAVCSFSVYCLGNFACPVPADLYLFGIILGLSGALGNLNRPAPSENSGWKPSGFPITAALTVLGLAAMLVAGKSLIALRAEREAAGHLDVLNWEAAFARLEQTGKAQPENYELQLQLARAAERCFLFSKEKHWNDAQETALETARQHSGPNLQVLLASIAFYQRNGRLDEAEGLIHKAEEAAPYSSYVKRARARNEIFRGNIAQAAKALDALDKTGLAIDDAALAELIFLLERQKADTGIALLRKAAGSSAKRADELGTNAAQAARRLKDYKTSLRILKYLCGLDSTNLKAAFSVAQIRAESGNTAAAARLLDRLKSRSAEMDEDLRRQVWEQWCDLQGKLGKPESVSAELESYLTTYPRDNWARLQLSALYVRQYKNARARDILRDGIGYDVDGSLRIQLGDLCTQHGQNDLARSYYQEAMQFSAQRKAAEERLKKVKPSEDELEIEQLLNSEKSKEKKDGISN